MKKTSIKEIEKAKVKEIKKNIEVQEIAMQVKNDIPPLEEEESLEEKLLKKQLKQFGKVYKDDDENEEELASIKNLEEELEDLTKEDKDKKEDTPYTTYGEMNKDYKKVESIKSYMTDPNKELTENQIIKNQQRAINREIQEMSEDMKMLKNSKPGEEFLAKQKDKFSQFKNMSEDYK